MRTISFCKEPSSDTLIVKRSLKIPKGQSGADPGFVIRGGGVSRQGVWGPLMDPSVSRAEPWLWAQGG